MCLCTERKSRSGKPLLSSQGSLDMSEVSQDSLTSDASTPHLLPVSAASSILPGQTLLVSAATAHKGESLLISHPGSRAAPFIPR